MSLDNFCHHIHQNGNYCQSPPMRERDYCYFHLQLIGRRMQMAKARARAERWELDLPVPEDIHAVQAGIAQLMDAVATDRIDRHRAQQLITLLRLSASTLRLKMDWELRQSADDLPDPSRAVADPAFEARYGLPGQLDLKLPPAVAFPPAADAVPASAPPQTDLGRGPAADPTSPSIPITVADVALWRHLHETSQTLRQPVQQGAAKALASHPPDHSDYPSVRLHQQALQIIADGNLFPVTAFDIECMEILKTEGSSAMTRRIHQREADERRQQARRQSRLARERFAGEAQARTAAKLALQLLTKPAAGSFHGEPQPSPPPADANPLIKIRNKPPQSEISAGMASQPTAAQQVTT